MEIFKVCDQNWDCSKNETIFSNILSKKWDLLKIIVKSDFFLIILTKIEVFKNLAEVDSFRLY